MQLVGRDAVQQAILDGDISVSARDGSNIVFLDEFRIGLRIDRLYSAEGEVDLAMPEDVDAAELAIENATLMPGQLYLATTRETLSLGAGYAATIHTRSRFARAGLECLVSSNFVVPGFGMLKPTPLVLEVMARLRTSGLSRDSLYFFFLLYRVSGSGALSELKDYWRRFPLAFEGEGLD